MSETNTETGPKTPIIPTPGRNVLVSVPGELNDPIVQGAGIVVGVNPRNPDEIFVLLAAPGVHAQTLSLGYNEREDVPYSWRWMPYQVQKAKDEEPVDVEYREGFRLILIDTTQSEQPRMIRTYASFETGDIVEDEGKAFGVAYTMYVPTEGEESERVTVAYRQNAIDPLVAFARGIPIPDELLRPAPVEPQGRQVEEFFIGPEGEMTEEEYFSRMNQQGEESKN